MLFSERFSSVSEGGSKLKFSGEHLLDNVYLPDPLPPLVITAFTRPDLLAPVLDSLESQTLQPNEIWAFIDGLRNHQDEMPAQACVDLLRACEQPGRSVHIVRRENNLGCDGNVIAAFTEILASYPYLVYVEDDNLLNPYFYDRMCRLLEAYKDCQSVFSISGYANLALSPDLIEADFFASHRVFSWGFGIWADRWNAMDLAHKSPQYNPFGKFYNIPLTVETKLTMTNQFWLEANKKTDWVITMTLHALHQGKVHLIPKYSLVKNIGFGHEQSETYRGGEGDWVNPRYKPDFNPEQLPNTLELPEPLGKTLSSEEAIATFFKRPGLWLNPQALVSLCGQYPSQLPYWLALFLQRLPKLLYRWRSTVLKP
jgi:hypothetical protein